MDHQSAIKDQYTERYLLGELDATETAEFEEHFFECPLCAEDIRLGSQLVANVKAVLREDAPVQTIEIDRDVKFLTLTIQRKASGSSSAMDCEFQFLNEVVPIAIPAPAADGSIQIRLPMHRVSTGPCTVILRDKTRHTELERHRFVIARS